MKKAYEKPRAAIEYYELSQAIAACETKIGYMNSHCVLEDSDATDQMKDLAQNGWFTSEGSCQESALVVDEFDGICYHTNANAMFSS